VQRPALLKRFSRSAAPGRWHCGWSERSTAQ
jgi:hypothetical protein